MNFPISLQYQINTGKNNVSQEITLQSGLTTLVGPNGAGKTQVLRAIKSRIPQVLAAGKIVRLLAAGRLWFLEQYRSDFNGHQGNSPRYEDASIGSKDDVKRRHNYETAQGDYLTLSNRFDIQVKVNARLETLFGRTILLEWDGGMLKPKFSSLFSEGLKYSSAREASGLLHLVTLLTALYDDEISVLLIDEPELSLHPQLQAFLLREIQNVAGNPVADPKKKLILIATHSTEMIAIQKPQDLCNIVFCSSLSEAPIQISPENDILKNTKLTSLIYRLGHEHKATFFCRIPFIVEGQSDFIIASALVRRLNLYSEAAGVHFIAASGKSEFPALIKLFRLMGKEPVIVSDADGFIDSIEITNEFINSSKAQELATKYGHPSLSQWISQLKTDFGQLVKSHWADIETSANTHPYIRLVKEEEKSTDKNRQRAAFSTLMSLSETELLKLSQDWQNIFNRLRTLLDTLESTGCFFLRKGTIESYYNSQKVDFQKKPQAAVEEIELWDDKVQIDFSELERALRFASSVKPIDEAQGIRDFLAAAASAVESKILSLSENERKSLNCNQYANSIIGDKSILFNIQIDATNTNRLSISLASKILDVEGFPLYISLKDNISEQLKEKICPMIRPQH